METNKKESKIIAFADAVENLGKETLGENAGFMMFCYEAKENGSQENNFMVKGKLGDIAESIYTFMKNNPALANVILAASNAYAHHQMMQSALANEVNEPKKDKKKKKVS